MTKWDVSEFVVHSQILEKFANFSKVYFSENLDFTKIFLELGFKSLYFQSKQFFLHMYVKILDQDIPKQP